MTLFLKGWGFVGRTGMIRFKSLSSGMANNGKFGEPKVAVKFFICFSKMFSVFRAVITEEFKVPDKMVGFSKYPHSLLSPD